MKVLKTKFVLLLFLLIGGIVLFMEGKTLVQETNPLKAQKNSKTRTLKNIPKKISNHLLKKEKKQISLKPNTQNFKIIPSKNPPKESSNKKKLKKTSISTPKGFKTKSYENILKFNPKQVSKYKKLNKAKKTYPIPNTSKTKSLLNTPKTVSEHFSQYSHKEISPLNNIFFNKAYPALDSMTLKPEKEPNESFHNFKDEITKHKNLFLLNDPKSNTASLTGAPRTISEYLFGYNAKVTTSPSYNNNKFQELIRSMDIGNYRYPGGTYGNYFNSRTGKGMRPQDQHKIPYTIEDFVKAIPSDEATITYMVNMARPTPATGVDFSADYNTLASDETFLLKQKDILEALEEFEKHGHLPEYLELGNEFYFGNGHGAIYAENPILYLKHAKQLAKSIKKLYPNIKIALIGRKVDFPVQEYWNEAIYYALNTDSELKNLISAVTQHHYIMKKGKFHLNNASTAKEVISEGFSYPSTSNRKKDFDNVPNGFEIWLTEYGAIVDGTHNTWASGLRALAMTFGFMEATSNITSFNFHFLGSEETFDAKNVVLNNNGTALNLLMKAAKEKNKAQKITFSDNPFFFDSNKSLVGWKFWKDEEQSVIIMNASDHSFDNYQIDSLFNGSNDFKIIQSFSETPWIAGSVRSNGNITTTEKNITSGSIDIPPFSISFIDNK